ncbi:hypothetical protein F3J16_27575 [Burkholderia sp. Ap-962]|uniref:hypothetical protein n=1 Tax=Burkholderia sp. Ap-962 TaxID=2608333 RepID=UPI00141EFA92|nr:hypothetical protein [Burkholderia sp. Ap-962]NIF73911.1 hypothetical protein [Burkholderia sp. Ap-962]
MARERTSAGRAEPRAAGLPADRPGSARPACGAAWIRAMHTQAFAVRMMVLHRLHEAGRRLARRAPGNGAHRHGACTRARFAE